MIINKQIIFIFTLCSLINFGYGQSLKSFNKLVSETKEYLIQYSKLKPNSDKNYSLQNSGLPNVKIKYIKTNLYDDGGYSKDSISEFNLIIEFQTLIIENIKQIISHDKFNKTNIKELISNYSSLLITISDDKKLYNFSLNEKTGGSYRSRISIMHYTDINQESLPTKEEIEKGIKTNPYIIFDGDGFNKIYSINTKEGTKYVLIGNVQNCSTCFDTYILLVKFKNGIFKQDFYYNVNLRNSKEGINYNPETKTISVDYTTDDLTTDCYCINYINENKEQYNSDIEPKQKNCHCTFVFNGLNFELIK